MKFTKILCHENLELYSIATSDIAYQKKSDCQGQKGKTKELSLFKSEKKRMKYPFPVSSPNPNPNCNTKP